MRGTANQILDSLVGSEYIARDSAQSGMPPGELGASDAVLVYLSDLQQAPPELAITCAEILINGRYHDRLCNSWKLPRRCIIAGGFRLDDEAARIDRDSYLCAAFSRRLEVGLPALDNDLASIAQSIWAETPQSDNMPEQIADLFPFVRQSPIGLHSLRTWIGRITRQSRSGSVTDRAGIQRVPLLDLEFATRSLVYRGRRVDLPLVEEWLGQFPVRYRPTAMVLLRNIAARYYFDSASYHSLLQDCIRACNLPAYTAVCFCGWQQLGKSGPKVAHQIRNQANWTASEDLDLSRPSTWAFDSNGAPRHFLLVDDFVGSGMTLSSTCEWLLPRLLATYPLSEVVVVVVVGFESGLRAVMDKVRQWGDRVRLVPGRVLTDRDRCFTPESTILKTAEVRADMETACRIIAKEHYPGLLRKGRHLGFAKIGSLVVFSDTIPNNSLPVLWHNSGMWKPLFPASGLPGVGTRKC